METFFVPRNLKRRFGGAYKETFLKLCFLTLSKKTTNFAMPLEVMGDGSDIGDRVR
jgi:hypothetical protein